MKVIAILIGLGILGMAIGFIGAYVGLTVAKVVQTNEI